jgi:hypothetical protein
MRAACVVISCLAAVSACSSTPTAPTTTSTQPTTTTTPTTTPTTTSTAPPASAGHNLVYANHLGMVLLLNTGLGGFANPGSSTPTRVWGWTGQEWQLLDSSGPPIRALAGVTYDTRRQTVVMYGGGYVTGRVYGETWEWSGAWRQVAATGPGERDHTQLAFDADRGRSVLFGGGGSNASNIFGDTWEYDGVTWTRIAVDGPPARVHHAMQYDAGNRRVTLVGGTSPATGTLGDVWTWDGSRWSSAGSIGTPRSHARMAFHRGLDALLLVGGFPVGLNLLAGRNSFWTSPGGSGPSPRYLTDIAYDERRNVTVLFGGDSPSGLLADTWEFDGASWRQIR